MNRVRAASRSLAATVFVSSLFLSARCAAGDVVTIVSPKNAVPMLSREQIADIFLGKTAHFPDGRPAVALDQVQSSEVREQFYQQIAGKSPAQMKAYWSKIIFTGRGQPPREVSGDSEMRKRVLESSNTIGYIGFAAVDATVRVVSP